MSLSNDDVAKKLSDLGTDEGAPIGWEAKVLQAIRDERAQTQVHLVRAKTARPAPARRAIARGMFWPASGFALAAAVALVFFGVREQKRNSQFAERKATIAMVVEFVGLETKMAQQLAEIDLEEARMDEAFHALQLARLDQMPVSTQPEAFEAPRLQDFRQAAPKRRVRPLRRAKARDAGMSESCRPAVDSLCGL